ncbi:MAG TPA: SIS domain-containing protein [Chthonomonadales bacterium]|nr:SIS domain-containing protein [Chthonomonadales bacterium]
MAIARYLGDVQRLLGELDEAAIDRLVDLLAGAWRSGRQVLLMGNGGSSATASHIVNDLQKCIQLETGRPLRAMCLSDNTPIVLAWANDAGYEQIYARQVECWASAGDVVIGISGSGNSPNVIQAMEAANALGAHTYGLSGCGGGGLACAAKDGLVAPSNNMQHIEDLHLVVLHAVFATLRDRLRSEARPT